ncbi:TPA: hypothetical protein TZW92_002128 [Streptococcus suis]|nr:hypothetical protein [Streptococcus suis]
MAIEQTPQTPQTPQTLPTSKVGQAFHALKGALGLYIAEQEKTLRSGAWSHYIKRAGEDGWCSLYEIPYDFLPNEYIKLVDRVVEELGLDREEEWDLHEGLAYVTDSCLCSLILRMAVGLGTSQEEVAGYRCVLTSGRRGARCWAKEHLDIKGEKVTFSTVAPRSWL